MRVRHIKRKMAQKIGREELKIKSVNRKRQGKIYRNKDNNRELAKIEDERERQRETERQRQREIEREREMR